MEAIESELQASESAGAGVLVPAGRLGAAWLQVRVTAYATVTQASGQLLGRRDWSLSRPTKTQASGQLPGPAARLAESGTARVPAGPGRAGRWVYGETQIVASYPVGETIGFLVWASSTTIPGAGGCVRVPAGRVGIW